MLPLAPVVPFVHDGVISSLRSYSPSALRALAAHADPAIEVELRGGLIEPAGRGGQPADNAISLRASQACCIGVVGEEVKQTDFTRAHRREYRRKVQLCLDVFETMLAQSSFEFERPLTGMEIECNLVDADYQPAMSNQEVLASIADPAYQTELGAYNIEFNVPPRPLPGRAALELEADVRASLNAAEAKANSNGAHIVMIGILPTLMPEHLSGGWMSESTRYQALNDSIFTARGEDILIDIAGPERLSLQTASIAPESACTSMQLHLQVSPAEFAQQLERRPGAGRPAAGAGRQLAVLLRSPAVARDPHRAVRPGHRHPPGRAQDAGRAPAGVVRRAVDHVDLRPVRGERPLLPVAAARTVRRGSRRRARRRPHPAACRNCGCTTARSTGGTGRSTTSSTAGRTCGWRTACCPPGPPWWT